MREPRSLFGARKATALREDLPEVESYYDKVHQAAWLGRNSGVWTGVGIGGLSGAVIGASISYMPFILGFTEGVLPSATNILSITALAAGLGSAYGMVVMPDVGVTAAAVAAGMEERERRDKMEKLRECDPELAEKIERERARKVDEFEAPGKNDPWAKRFAKRFGQYYDIRVGVIGVALSAVVGAVLALNPYTATAIIGDQGLRLITASTGALPDTGAIITSAAMFGMFGSGFGVKMAMVSNVIANSSYQILTGNIFGRDVHKREQALNKASEVAVERYTQLHSPIPLQEQQPEQNQLAEQAEREVSYRQMLVDRAAAQVTEQIVRR